MGNCLKTQLKETVQNDNLLIFGSFQIKAHQKTELTSLVAIRCKSEFNISVTGGGNFSLSSDFSTVYTSKDFSANTMHQVYFSSGEYNINISKKYDIDYINTGYFGYSYDTSDVKYLTKLGTLIFNGTSAAYGSELTGKVVDIINLPINVLSLINSKVYGTTDEIANIPTLTELNLYSSRNISGNIKTLAPLPLTKLSLGGTNIDGTIEEFVAELRKKTTSGNLQGLSGLPSNVYFGTYGMDTRAYYLEWTASTIYLFVGSMNKANASMVYAKGATAQEISDWESAGKTVTVIE